MADYDLGTARGKIVIDGSEAEAGLNKVDTATQKMGMSQQQAASTLQTTGVAMIGMGGAAVAGFALAVKTSADFEKQISAIGAVSGATESEMGKLRDKALQLGADTSFSASEAAAAMEELSKAGISVTDILGGAADATTALAAAGGVDLPTAAAIASNAMNQFGLDAQQLPHVADLIAGAANASAIDVTDFGMSMSQAGATANLVGLSFDDMALAITAMGNAGIKGSDAGTSLKTMLSNLQPSTDKQAKLFDELGITTDGLNNKFFTAEGSIRSMSEIAGVLETALYGMTDAQKAMALETLFGSDAIRAAAVISGEGAAGMDELSAAIGKISAEDVAEKRMDNLAGSIEKLKGSIETVLIGAGAPFQKVLQGVVDGITSLVNGFGALPESFQTFLVSLLAVGGGLLVFAGTGSLVLGTFLKFGQTLRDVKAALAVVKEVQLLSKAMGVLNAVMALNPIILIVLAIIALGAALYLLYTKSETFRKFVDGLWQGIQKVWDAVLGFFKRIPGYLETAFNAIKDKVTGVIDWIKENWDLLLPIFLGPLGLIILGVRRFGDDVVNFVKSIPDRVKEGFGKLKGIAENVVSDFINGIQAMPGEIGRILGLIIGSVVRFGVDFVQNAWDTATGVVTTFIDILQALPGKVGEILGFIIGSVIRWVADMVANAYSMGTQVLSTVIQFFQQLPGKVWEFISGAFNVMVAFAPMIISKAWEMGSGVVASIVGFLSGLPGQVAGFFSNIVGSIANGATNGIRKAWEFGSGVASGILGFITGIPEKIKEAMDKAIRMIKDGISGAARAAKDFGAGIWNGFKDGIGIHSPSYVEKAMTALVTNVGQDTKNLRKQVGEIQGLGNNLNRLNSPSASAYVSAGAIGPANGAAATISPTAGTAPGAEQAPTMLVQGPLVQVENLEVRSDDDIQRISRGLSERIQSEQLAQGRKVLTTNAAR